MNNPNRVAIYCRLSKDDEQSGDSVSIETQKMMLTGYCTNQGFDIVDLYIDDGYSGLNFDRPSFKRLIEDLENDKFDIIVTKDLSRLGRDYIQTGYYIDMYFPAKHIRYIAVNDGIDTLLGNNDIAPFKNILNDMYAKDLSRKVKSAKQQRAKNGLYISAQPPYGYKVDPYNKNRLVVDPEPASIVKRIFDLACSGNSYSEISRILEREKIVSPSAYKVMTGDTRFLKLTSMERLYKWSYQTVRTIVCNPVYVGDMVNHKYETVNYKTKERVRVPKENQIVVSNTHEPIIDRSVFETLNKNYCNRRLPNHHYENIFKGVIFCAECGEEMQLIANRVEGNIRPLFRCPVHATNKLACTHHHFIHYDELLAEVKKQLDIQITKLINSSIYDELCARILESISNRAQDAKSARLQAELQQLNKAIKDKYRALPSNTRANEVEELYDAQRALMKKLTEKPISCNKLPNLNTDGFKHIIKNYLHQTPLDESTLKLFIEKIEIGHLEKNTSGATVQKIKIYYRFRPIPS